MVRILVNLPKNTILWLDKEAERLGISRSELIRRFLDEKKEKTK